MLSPDPGVDSRTRREPAPRGLAVLDPAADAAWIFPGAFSRRPLFLGLFRISRGLPALSRGKAEAAVPVEDFDLLRKRSPVRTGRCRDSRAPRCSWDRAPELHSTRESRNRVACRPRLVERGRGALGSHAGERKWPSERKDREKGNRRESGKRLLRVKLSPCTLL